MPSRSAPGPGPSCARAGFLLQRKTLQLQGAVEGDEIISPCEKVKFTRHQPMAAGMGSLPRGWRMSLFALRISLQTLKPYLHFHSAMPKGRHNRNKMVDLALDAAPPLLDFAENALELVPVPGLPLIAKSLSVLVDRVKVSEIDFIISSLMRIYHRALLNLLRAPERTTSHAMLSSRRPRPWLLPSRR